MESSSRPIWHGVVLVAGGAVGAGMFALPVVASGMWFSWAVFGLLLTWGLTMLAAQNLVDVSHTFSPGDSFHTIVQGVLGARVAWVNNLAIAFIMYILMYAYITAGASIIEHSVSSSFGEVALPQRGVLSLLFALVIGGLVWLGTSIVSRFSTLLMVCLVIMFVVANASLSTLVNWQTLMPGAGEIARFPFLWAALPVFVTAFACAGLVPSLVKYYANRPDKVSKCLLYGTLLVLLIYLIWLTTTFGALPRPQYLGVIQAGGNIGDLVSAFQENGVSKNLKASLDWFSNFAILTSFLSIGLGLFHFLMDGFKRPNTALGRAQAALIAFIPPALASYFFPYGFIKAIGYAGLLVAFSFFVIPAWMHIKQRGLSWQSSVVMCFGITIAALKILLVLGLLPLMGE